MINLSSRT